MCDENGNEQEGKVAPSTLDLHGRASEEHPEAKENLDSPAKVIVEPLKPFENGHHLPAADVPAAVDEVECSRVDTPMPSSTNVADSQQCSVEHNCESSEAAAPLDSEPDVTTCKDMNISDNHGAPVEPARDCVETLVPLYTENEVIADENAEVLDNLIHSVEPICESVEGSTWPMHESVEGSTESIHESVEGSVEPIRESVKGSAESIHESVEGFVEPMHGSVEGSVGPIDQCVEGFVGPINQRVEGSVEPSHESVEPFMDPIYESVDADEVAVDENGGTTELAWQESEVNDSNLAASHLQYGEPVVLAKVEDVEINENKPGDAEDNQQPAVQEEFASHVSSHAGDLENKTVEPTKIDALTEENGNASSEHFFLDEYDEGCVSGTEEQQSWFMKVLEKFFKERRNVEFKPPKFYGEGLNCLKLWRSVIRLGGYDKVTSSKLWRQVGESFRPPNLVDLIDTDGSNIGIFGGKREIDEIGQTCTTVSWTFRGFYEKALLDFEREKISAGELNIQAPSTAEPMSVDNQSSVSVRTPRDSAARARQGWHLPRLLGHREVSDPIIKEKSAFNAQKREKQLKNSGSLKRKKQPFEEDADTTVQPKSFKTQVDVSVVDIGLPADWVKVNVQKTMDCFEVYALVPGLLREEVRVQSDPAGRLVISGDPEQPDNPWGVTPFKKVINLPLRIDPRQTSAVVTLHGQLFVRIPFEQADQ